MRTIIQPDGPKRIWTVLLFLILALGLPRDVRAHTGLVRSVPAPGSSGQAPAEINLWFNELLEPGFISVAIIPGEELNLAPSAQFNLALGPPAVDSQDRTRLRVEVAPLPPGDYQVAWRVLYRDGHTAAGQFNFRVTGSL